MNCVDFTGAAAVGSDDGEEEYTMAAQSHAARFASVTLTGKGQNTDHIRQIMDKILNLADCSKCGRIALLRVDFLGDPPPDLAHDGIISFTSQGLGAH